MCLIQGLIYVYLIYTNSTHICICVWCIGAWWLFLLQNYFPQRIVWCITPPLRARTTSSIMIAGNQNTSSYHNRANFLPNYYCGYPKYICKFVATKWQMLVILFPYKCNAKGVSTASHLSESIIRSSHWWGLSIRVSNQSLRLLGCS